MGSNRYSILLIRDLQSAFKADHGYESGSRIIQILIEMLCGFNRQERRQFLSFVTGSPRLPLGGFKALEPSLTIVRKTVASTENVNNCLPSVMTCAHYLKVPEYRDISAMRGRFLFAMKEGQGSFHLS